MRKGLPGAVLSLKWDISRGPFLRSEFHPLLPAECREKTKVALLELKATLEANPKVVAHYPVEVRFTRGRLSC